MDADIVRQAVLGTPDAWTLLLRAGAESLLDAVRFQPEQKKLTEDDFCEEDDSETLSEREVRAALNFARNVNAALSGLPYMSLRNDALCDVLSNRLVKRVPTNRVVQFMRLCRRIDEQRKSTRSAVARLCGNVGSWLAGFKAFREDAPSNLPAWGRDVLSTRLPALFSSERLEPEQAKEEALRLWENEKSVKGRLEALKALRRLDPDGALELLDKVFAKEKPETRAELLDALTINLGDRDVPFLEKAFKGKSAEIKRTALLLLCKIPTTPQARAMQERAELVAAGETPTRDDDCEIAQFPKEEKSLAFSVVQALPLKYWTEQYNLTPKRLVERFPFDSKTEPLYLGWAQAFLNDVYDYRRQSELDDPQVVLDAYPGAFEWLDVFFDLWEKLGELSAGDAARIEKIVPPDFIVHWELSLTSCDPHTASRRGLIDKTGFKKKDVERWAYRVEYEPKPYSDEFMRKYVNRLERKKNDYYDVALLARMIHFTPEWRKEIVQTIRDLPVSSDDWIRERLKDATGIYEEVEEFVSCFGEYEDPPLKRPSDC
ncbi:MAG: hypothetical protein IK077_02400 [Thermoguttaceae bacterium]|nr:hypothetical protein [Thermoguttaceae bacterium]